MNAFAAAIDVLFGDENLAIDALYRQGGTGSGVPVRVIRHAPDRSVNFSEGRYVTDTMMIDVRTSEIAELSAGDTFEIEATILAVRSEPMRDSDRLIWMAEVRAP